MQKVIVWIALAAVSLGAWACDDEGVSGGGSGGSGSCPQDNPECKEIATESAGARAVEKRRCVECHDSQVGKMAGRTEPLPGQDPGIELYPPNLTGDDATGIGGWGDDQLAAAIRTGLDKQGLQLCPQMKHFADMSDFEVYSIVKYLRSLPKVSNKIPRSVCPPLKTKDEQNQSR